MNRGTRLPFHTGFAPHFARSALLALFFATPALAQDDSELFRPTTSGPFVTFTAPITPPGRLLLQPIVMLSMVEDSNVERQLDVFQAFMEYGLTRRFALGAQLQINHTQARENVAVVSRTAVADSLVFGRTVFWFEQGNSPWPEVTAVIQLKLPTGRPPPGRPFGLDTDVTGTGTLDAAFGFDFTKGVKPFLLHLDLFATHAFAGDRGGEVFQYAPMLTWSASAEWVYAVGQHALMVEFSGKHRGQARLGGVLVPGSTEHELAVGAGFELIASDDVQALAGIQRTVWSVNVPTTTSFIVTVVPFI